MTAPQRGTADQDATEPEVPAAPAAPAEVIDLRDARDARTVRDARTARDVRTARDAGEAPAADVIPERRRVERQPVVEATMPGDTADRRPTAASVVGVTACAVLVVGFYVALPIALLARNVVPQTVFLAPAVIVTGAALVIRRVLRATVTEPVIDLTEPA